MWERGDSVLSGKPFRGKGYPYIRQVFLKPDSGPGLVLGAGLTGMKLAGSCPQNLMEKSKTGQLLKL